MAKLNIESFLKTAPVLFELFTLTHPLLPEPIYCVKGHEPQKIGTRTYVPIPVTTGIDSFGSPHIRIDFIPELEPIIDDIRHDLRVKYEIVAADNPEKVLATFDGLVLTRD